MSKNIFPSILLSLIFILLSSCEKVQKDVNAYYPDVTTVSATALADGSVDVKAEIINSGTSDLEYIGFCMDTINPPSMLSNQMIVSSINGNTFSANYATWFERNKRYYFRSWATNEKGYSYGNIVILDSIKSVPLVIPCTPPMNTIDFNSVYDVSYPTYDYHEWQVVVKANGGDYYFDFGSKPTNKIYTVSQVLGPNNVRVTFLLNGSNSGSLKDGGLVYVSQTSAHHWIITVCAAPYIIQGFTSSLTGKFDCPK